MDFHEGDVGYIERSMPHYIENLGDMDLVFLGVFPTPEYQGISVAEWLAHTPSRLCTSLSVLARTFRAKSPERKQSLRPNDRDRAQLELT
jgi:oxalate decarboxylase